MIMKCPARPGGYGTATSRSCNRDKQDQHEVTAGAMLGDQAWPGKLHSELCALIAPVFAQARSRFAAFACVAALLTAPGDRRSCWQLGEQAGHDTPRRMQPLLADCAWDWRTALQRFILAHLANPAAILVLDETAELKGGTMTVGVARQQAGITGQIENCQTVVFLAYVTARAHAVQLPPLPAGTEVREPGAARARPGPRRHGARGKDRAGTAMVTDTVTASVPFGWVAGDDLMCD
jgi:SRSO17 transposase